MKLRKVPTYRCPCHHCIVQGVLLWRSPKPGGAAGTKLTGGRPDVPPSASMGRALAASHPKDRAVIASRMVIETAIFFIST